MRTESVGSVTSQQVLENNSKQALRRDNNQINTQGQPDSLQDNKKYNRKKLEEKVKKSVEDINEIVDKVKEGLSFKMHDKTDTLMVQVIDIKTQEVIKELPPEEILDLSARIHEMVGVLIDEKV